MAVIGVTQHLMRSWTRNRYVRWDHLTRRDWDRYKPYEGRGWAGEVELDAMDVEGIDAAVIYPSRGLFALTIPDMDTRLAAAMARAYNDWLYEFCQVDTGRLMAAGMISAFDIEDAVSEARCCVEELGFKGIFLRPNMVNGHNWHDPYYEPLWSTLEELEVPLGFHEGGSPLLGAVGQQFGANRMLQHVFQPSWWADGSGRQHVWRWRAGAASQPSGRLSGGELLLAALPDVAAG